jgi:hypothetical protein
LQLSGVNVNMERTGKDKEEDSSYRPYQILFSSVLERNTHLAIAEIIERRLDVLQHVDAHLTSFTGLDIKQT